MSPTPGFSLWRLSRNLLESSLFQKADEVRHWVTTVTPCSEAGGRTTLRLESVSLVEFVSVLIWTHLHTKTCCVRSNTGTCKQLESGYFSSVRGSDPHFSWNCGQRQHLPPLNTENTSQGRVLNSLLSHREAWGMRGAIPAGWLKSPPTISLNFPDNSVYIKISPIWKKPPTSAASDQPSFCGEPHSSSWTRVCSLPQSPPGPRNLSLIPTHGDTFNRQG